MRELKPVTLDDLAKKYGIDLVKRADDVKMTDRDNPSPQWNTETLCVLYISFSKSPKIANATRATKVQAHQINHWRRSNPAFDEFINSARDEGVSVIEDALFKAAERGNVNAQIAVLRAYRPDLYGNQTRITMNAQPGQNYDLSKLSSEEVEMLEKLSSKAMISSSEKVPNEQNPLVQRALQERSKESKDE